MEVRKENVDLWKVWGNDTAPTTNQHVGPPFHVRQCETRYVVVKLRGAQVKGEREKTFVVEEEANEYGGVLWGKGRRLS